MSAHLQNLVVTVGEQALPVYASVRLLRPNRVLLIHGGGKAKAVAQRVLARAQVRQPELEGHLFEVDPYKPVNAFTGLRSANDLDVWFAGSDLVYGPGTTPMNVAVSQIWLSKSGGEGTLWWPGGRDSLLMPDHSGANALPFPSFSLEDLAALNGVQNLTFDWSMSSLDERFHDVGWLETFGRLAGRVLASSDGVIEESLEQEMRTFANQVDGFSFVRGDEWTVGNAYETFVCVYLAQLARHLNPNREVLIYRSVKFRPSEPHRLQGSREFDVVAVSGSRSLLVSCFNSRAQWETVRGTLNSKFREIESRTGDAAMLIGREGRAVVIANTPNAPKDGFRSRRLNLAGRENPQSSDLRTVISFNELVPELTWTNKDVERDEWIRRVRKMLQSPLAFAEGAQPVHAWLKESFQIR